MNPDFHIPTRVYLQPGVLAQIGDIVSGIGSRALIITTSNDLDRFEEILESMAHHLSRSGIHCIVYDEIGEDPNNEMIDSAVYFTKKTNCDIVIGFGGIDSINDSKEVALLANNFLFCEDLFDTPEINPPIRLVTIPTHPLFGFEILPMFIISDTQHLTKRLYQNQMLFPFITVVDPSIAVAISDEVTAQTSISALAVATESIIAKTTNDFTNTYALKCMDLIFKFLVPAYKDPRNPANRLPLATASLMAGIALSYSGLSVSLAVALAVSSVTGVKIEHAMGVILPHVMEYNLTASPGRYVQMAKVMDEDVRDITVIEAAIKAIEGVRRISMDVDIPQRLSQFNIAKAEFTRVAELAVNFPFLSNAPRPLNKDEIETILIAAY